MLVFVKLGGSLITDKRSTLSFRQSRVEQLASEIRTALDMNSDLRLLIGHGSGAFGHVPAQHYRTIEGVHSVDQWRGFAQVATVAAELNYRVASVFSAAGLPVWRIQPSASAACRDGVIESMALYPLKEAVEHNLIPLIYGDVALDSMRGGTIISTEKIFTYLAGHMPVSRILLLGEVAGVFGENGCVIDEITPDNLSKLIPFITGAAGTDVTGGMSAKVQEMVNLVKLLPRLTVHILDGTQNGLLYDALSESHIMTGTTIRSTATSGL